MSRRERRLEGRRVLITGAARGIGALTARRLHERGARVALLGLEPAELAAVAAACGDAPWLECDVADRDQVDAAVAGAVERLGGLDVAIANAGIGAQMTLVGGDASVWDATFAVNLMGSYNLVRAAGPHVSHPRGYFLVTASLALARVIQGVVVDAPARDLRLLAAAAVVMIAVALLAAFIPARRAGAIDPMVVLRND